MKLKNVLAALALSATATLAVAGPIFSATATTTDGGSFSTVYNFSLSSDQLVSGSLSTHYLLVSNDLTISSVVLSNGSVSYTFDGVDDLTSLLLTEHLESTQTIKGFTKSAWADSYTLDSVLLKAGDWTLTVNGTDINNKNAGSYAIALEGSTVPEPQSLALTLVALGLAGAVWRRQRAAH